MVLQKQVNAFVDRAVFMNESKIIGHLVVNQNVSKTGWMWGSIRDDHWFQKSPRAGFRDQLVLLVDQVLEGQDADTTALRVDDRQYRNPTRLE